MIAIKTADLRQDFKKIAEQVVQGEKILISRPKNENIVMLTESEYKELEQIKAKAARAELMATIKALKQAAEDSGAEEMSMDEIDAEITAYRKEKRALNAKGSN
jgi:antitoxin YefM